MKALQAACIVGAITFTGMIHQVGGNTPDATVPDTMPEAAVSAETPGAPALSAAVPEASAGSGTALGAEPGSVPGAVSGPSLMAKADIGDDSIETKWWTWATMMPPNRCRQRAMRPTMPPTRRR